MILALLLVIGCVEEADSGADMVAGLEAQCTTDEDCPLGTICRKPYQICVTSLHNPSVVAVAATPPTDTVLPVAHVANVSFDENNQLTLVFPESVVISGVVNVAGNLAEPAVASTIVAVAKDEIIKGTSMRSQTNATNSGFSLRLVKGVSYVLSVKIDDADPPRPAHRFEMSFANSQTGVELTLPALDEYPVVQGRAYRMTEAGKQPLKDIQVTALHVKTREQCTSAVTNNLGAYELRCPILGGPYNVLVGAIDGGPVIPSFTALFPTSNYRVNEIGLLDNTKVPDIVIGEQSRDAEVSVRVLDAYGKAQENMPVTLESSLDDTAFWQDAVFRRTGLTGSDGKISFVVLEGIYHLQTVPHTSSPLAMHVEKAWDIKTFPEKTVTLVNKVNVTGTLVSFLGNPITGAEVIARTTWLNEATQSTTVREYVVISDETGRFDLPVDAGTYDIRISPGESSGLPRTWLNEQVNVEQSKVDIGQVLLAPPQSG